VFDLIATVLAWFYDLIPNYAVAIALLTLSVMVLLTPLTLKGTKSMLAMQRLQPEMKRIQQQYKGDRQKLNEELMKFYQENKINPLGGCLPLLLQMPVFFVLYRVLHQLTRTCASAAMIAAGECTTIGNFAPSYLDHSTKLWQDLTATDQMLAFGMDLSQSAANQMRDSFVGALPYLVLILAVTATSYIQQLQISARNKSGTPINPQQAMLLKILPAFFAFISLTLPAGIVVYFLVSNLYRIAQQAYITRAFYRQDAAKEAELEAKGKPEPKAGSSEPKAPVLPPAAKKAQAQAAKSGKPTPKPVPKGNGSASTPAARPKPKSSGMTARPAPRPTSSDASADTGSEADGAPPAAGSTPPPKKKKR
jgi:YidC/Oxa1 family membrane protein insertase